MATSELAVAAPKPLAERERPQVDIRRVLELRATLQAQDDQMVLDAVRGGYVDHVADSVRLCPTGETDPEDNSPVFASVGAKDSPDEVLSPMTGSPFTLRHRSVTGPGTGGRQLASPERAALLADSTSLSNEEKED